MFLSFLIPFRSMVRGSRKPSVDILVLVPYSNHGTRTRMSTDKSRASNQRSSTCSRRGFSQRAKTGSRTRRGFSRRAKTGTRTRRGFSRRAKTRTRNRRVLLSPQSTALPLSIYGRTLRVKFNFLVKIFRGSFRAPKFLTRMHSLILRRIFLSLANPKKICGAYWSKTTTIGGSRTHANLKHQRQEVWWSRNFLGNKMTKKSLNFL